MGNLVLQRLVLILQSRILGSEVFDLFLKSVTALDQRRYNTAQIQIRHSSADVIALCHP
jgi:hypothetical protein